MSKKIARLSKSDWDELLPGKIVKIGSKSFTIEPLGIYALGMAMRKLSGLAKELSKSGLTADNYNTPEMLPILFGQLLIEAPQLLEEMVGLHRADISSLPVGKGIELLKTVIEVNVESQEELVKNLHALAEMVAGKATQTGE